MTPEAWEKLTRGGKLRGRTTCGPRGWCALLDIAIEGSGARDGFDVSIPLKSGAKPRVAFKVLLKPDGTSTRRGSQIVPVIINNCPFCGQPLTEAAKAEAKGSGQR